MAKKIANIYLNKKKMLNKSKNGAAEKLRSLSSWMYENTYKKFTIGNNYW